MNISKIAPYDELIKSKSVEDALIDDVIWVAPKILYGELILYPLVELFAIKLGKSEVPLSTICDTNSKSETNSFALLVSMGISEDICICGCSDTEVARIPAAVFFVVTNGNPASNPLFRTSTITEYDALTLFLASILPPLPLIKREPEAYIPNKPNEMLELFRVACPPLFTLIA